jgi:hypothetical protein
MLWIAGFTLFTLMVAAAQSEMLAPVLKAAYNRTVDYRRERP